MPSKLSKHIDDILKAIVEGETFRNIAQKYDVSLSTLHEYINKPEHSARASHALALSASQYANKAEQVLINAEKDKIEIQRARELAHHYRWMAGKRNPKKYSERNTTILEGGEKAIEINFNE